MEKPYNSGAKYSLEDFQIGNASTWNFETILLNKKLVLKQSRDVFQDMLLTIEQKKTYNSANGTEDNLGIIFCRYNGFDDKKLYLKAVGDLYLRLLQLNNLYIYFEHTIPLKINDEIMNIVTSLFSGVPMDTRNIDIEKILKNDIVFEVTGHPVVNSALKTAFLTVLREYISNEVEVNASKLKNFIIKILSWCKEYTAAVFRNKISNHNPKIVYYGSIKKHEAYFLMIMSLVGCDILILDPTGSCQWRQVDKFDKYSYSYEGRFKENIVDAPFSKIKVSEHDENNHKPQLISNGLTQYSNIANITLKNTMDVFNDIKNTIKSRGGYIDGNNPIIPVYFQRYIGVEDGEYALQEFYNKVYLLDKELSEGQYNYLKFIDYIPLPKVEESSKFLSRLERIFQGKRAIDKNLILEEVYKNKLLPLPENECISNAFKRALMETMTLYLKNEDPNLSKTKNFLVKLLVWINRYSQELLVHMIKGKLTDKNPKVLYYGEIKHSEIYLLIYLSKIGCDVLYINSNHEGDRPLEMVDKEEAYSRLQKNAISVKLEPFPQDEKIIRKSTVAYEASSEIHEMLFTPDTGLYKPWQFQDFSALPVTLKTTFDEIGILWNEDAKVRSGFKILNKTVYVPNLFAKINGTYEDIRQYWNFVSKLKASPLTHFITEIPFSKIDYTREEMFSLSYILNHDGTIDEDKLKKNKFYKYSYLKTSLQSFIIAKINETLKSDYFLMEMDNKLRLKILMTSLNIQGEILEMLQGFDFPQAIPKLVIYANNKSSFSEEDAIVLVLLNLIGMDIIILTPTNYNNIENIIKQEVFDTHQLPRFNLDLQLNLSQPNEKEQKSLFSKIFKLS